LQFSAAEADHLVKIPKRVGGTVTWQRVNDSERAALRVENSQGQLLELRLRVNPDFPEQLHVILLWQGRNVRRLDIREDHVNPDRDAAWWGETHKHRWTDEHNDGWAYTPTDIPEPDGPVTPAHYREIVEAFCWECSIDPSDLAWTDPDMTRRTP
jgi:hypothetical protein